MPLTRLLLACAAGVAAVAVVVPTQAGAINSCGVPYENGTYLISSATHLRQLGDPPSTPCNTSYDVRLLADIDLTGSGELTPFGTSSSKFSGTFDGQGHSITGLQITSPPESGFGLIGWAEGATIRDVQVVGTVSSPTENFGGLLVGNSTDTTITNVRTHGSVVGDGGIVGGIVGVLEGGSLVRSSSSAAVRGLRAGGLVGQAQSGSPPDTVIRDSYSTGAVSASPNSTWSIGGIAGSVCAGASVSLLRNYFTGTLTPGGTATAGGIAGSGSCLFWVGTLATTAGNLWNSDTTGPAGAGGTVGVGKTTAQMKDLGTYTALGWSIVNGWEPAGSSTWGICPQVNDGYPFLQGQTPSTACKAPTATPAVQPTPAAQPTSAALTATLLPSRRRVVSGQRVRIGIRTANTGRTAAQDVTSCVRLPSKLVITSAGGAVRSGRTACFRLGTVAAGARVTKVLTLRAVSLRRASVTVTGTARATGLSRVNAPSVTVTINPRAVRARVTG